MRKRQRESIWFHLTVESMKHRIRSHSTDDTYKQPSTHTSDRTNTHTHIQTTTLIKVLTSIPADKQKDEGEFLILCVGNKNMSN